MTIGTTILWLTTALLFLFGLWGILLNYYDWLYLEFTKREHHSPIPLVGGLLCSIALYNSPQEAFHSWGWLPFFLDPGCAYLIGVFIYSAIVTRRFKIGM